MTTISHSAFAKMSAYLDLWAALASCVISGLMVYLVPLPPLQCILALPFFFFFPGYTFLAALYLSHQEYSLAQRLFSSAGMSIVLVGLALLPVTYLLGFTRDTAYITISGLTLSFSLLAMLRRLKIKSTVTAPSLALSLPLPRSPLPLKRLVSLESLALMILALAFALFILSGARSAPRYTEFYVLGSDSRLAGYPVALPPGAPLQVKIGLVNHENRDLTYALSFCAALQCRPITAIPLPAGARWERDVTIPLQLAPGIHKISFKLQAGAGSQPAQELHLWVSVGG